MQYILSESEYSDLKTATYTIGNLVRYEKGTYAKTLGSKQVSVPCIIATYAKNGNIVSIVIEHAELQKMLNLLTVKP